MSEIYAYSILMVDNLARDFGYPPHFLVVCIFQVFLNEIIDLQINKTHFRDFNVFSKWVKVACQFS